MQESDNKLSITLKFGSRVLSMKVERSEEYLYREAEKLINERFSYYANKYPNQGRELYLLMASLDIAVDLKRMQAEAGSMEEILSTLVGEVEKELK